MTPNGSKRPRRGFSNSARWRASITSSPTNSPNWRATLAARLDAIEGGSAGLAKLEAAVAETAAAYTHAATALSDQRSKAAARLDAAVAGELVPLKLDAARFRTLVERLPAERWGRMAWTASNI